MVVICSNTPFSSKCIVTRAPLRSVISSGVMQTFPSTSIVKKYSGNILSYLGAYKEQEGQAPPYKGCPSINHVLLYCGEEGFMIADLPNSDTAFVFLVSVGVPKVCRNCHGEQTTNTLLQVSAGLRKRHSFFSASYSLKAMSCWKMIFLSSVGKEETKCSARKRGFFASSSLLFPRN